MLKVKLQYLATWCEKLTHLKRPWCWERLRPGGVGDDRGWDGWMASPTWWTWVWVNSGSWWWTGRPGVLWFMGQQRVGRDWVNELNWTWATATSCPFPSQPQLLYVLRENNTFHITTIHNGEKFIFWLLRKRFKEPKPLYSFYYSNNTNLSALETSKMKCS